MTPSGTGSMKRLGLCILLMGMAGGPAMRASQPPDWLAAAIKAPATNLKIKGTDHALLEEDIVRYLPEGKLREIYRQVIRVDSADGAVRVHMGRMFNADTDRVLKAQAWIVSPDGRATSAYGRNDFVEVSVQPGTHYWNHLRVIGFSRANEVPVGGTVALQIELERQTGMVDRNWSFQAERPVVRSTFEVIPPPGEHLVFHASKAQIPAPQTGEAPGSLRWEMHDLTPLPHDLPRGFINNPPRVFVRSMGPTSIASQMQTWSEFAGLAAKIVEPLMGATPAVIAQSQSIVHGKVTRWDRIRALAESVQKQVAYLSVTLDTDSLAGMRPHTPDEVLQSRLGDCKDKSTLLVALLRASGENAYAVLAHSDNPKAVMPEWPSQVFNHMVVAIAADADVPARWPVVDGGLLGRLVVFDPTDTGTPLGLLPQSDQLGFGLVLSARVPGLVTLPAEEPEQAELVRKTTAELMADGRLVAAVEEMQRGSRGASAHASSAKMGAEKFRQSLESQLHATLPLLSDLSWTEDWLPVEARRNLSIKFKAAEAMRRAGPGVLLVCPQLMGSDSRVDPWKTDADGAVWLAAGGTTEEVRLLLPEGFSLESVPKDWKEELPFVQATLQYRQEGRMLCYTRKILRRACLLDKTEYEAMSRFSQKLVEAERRPALLRRVQPTAGN